MSVTEPVRYRSTVGIVTAIVFLAMAALGAWLVVTSSYWWLAMALPAGLIGVAGLTIELERPKETRS